MRGVVITGSHGGLIGGDAGARAQGRGPDRGLQRRWPRQATASAPRACPRWRRKGIAAVTVGHDTARIGDAHLGA
jgi:hypothetical protein